MHAGIHSPSCEQNQTGVKILPCPKLRLRPATRKHSSRRRTAHLLTGGGAWGGDAVGGMLSITGRDIITGMTDRCKNITLPQTSFVGSNK